MLYMRRRLTGTPYSSFTYQRNPSDPIINPSPISMGRIFFNGAQTICCLKLAIAFDAQSSRPGIAPFLDGAGPNIQHRVSKAAYLVLNFVFYVTTMYTANYLPVIVVI